MASFENTPGRHRLLGLLVSLGVAGALFVSGGPANGQGMRYTDPAGDMWTETDVNAPEPTYVPAPTIKNGDLLGGSISHNRSAVVIRQTFADLSKVNRIAFLTSATIRTNEGRTRFIDVGWDATSGTFAELSRPSADGLGTVVPCELTGQLRFDTNTMVVRIPRTCLSSPRWIKVDAGLAFTDVSDTSYFVDVARTSASPDSPIIETRRLFRG
jgi:hypothetical protein